jgi:hypothetical protein
MDAYLEQTAEKRAICRPNRNHPCLTHHKSCRDDGFIS